NTPLSPGVYCGGIKVKSGTATFSSGNYIIVGGGISTQDSNSHIVGSGVFFYNTDNSSNVYKPLQFSANADVNVRRVVRVVEKDPASTRRTFISRFSSAPTRMFRLAL